LRVAELRSSGQRDYEHRRRGARQRRRRRHDRRAGTAQRLFGALREDGISVILISQGSSEHSICFAIPQAEAERTARTVRHAFHAELNGGQIQNVDVVRGCSILSVVGDGMAGTPGVAAQVFGSLGARASNVKAIAQGSSERNISVVIEERQTTKAPAIGAFRLLSLTAHGLAGSDRPPAPSAACFWISWPRRPRG
jgi:aspartokinase